MVNLADHLKVKQANTKSGNFWAKKMHVIFCLVPISYFAKIIRCLTPLGLSYFWKKIEKTVFGSQIRNVVTKFRSWGWNGVARIAITHIRTHINTHIHTNKHPAEHVESYTQYLFECSTQLSESYTFLSKSYTPLSESYTQMTERFTHLSVSYPQFSESYTNYYVIHTCITYIHNTVWKLYTILWKLYTAVWKQYKV